MVGELNRSITPGVIDTIAKRVFTTGGCGALAIALHDITGWPIVAITDHHNVHDGVSSNGSALHWAVRHPGGPILDINGFHNKRQLIEAYNDKADDGKAAIGLTTREHAIQWWQEAGEKVSLDVAKNTAETLLHSFDDERL